MADVEAGIKVSVEQADQSAAQLRKVATAVGDVEKAHTGLGRSMGGKFEAAGLKELSRLILSQTVPGFERARSAVTMLTAGVRSLLASMSIAAGPVTAVVAAIGALGFAYKAASDYSRKMREENAKNYQSHIELLKGYQEAEHAGVNLSEASRGIVDAVNAMIPVEREAAIATMKKKIADAEATASGEGLLKNTVSLRMQVINLLGGEKAMNETRLKGNVTLAQARAALAALTSGYKDEIEAVKQAGKDQAALNESWAKAAEAKKALLLGRANDPNERARIELMALDVEKKARQRSLSENIRDFEQYQRALTALEEEYADRRALVNEDAARKTRQVWIDNLRALEGPMTDLALRLPRAFREGGDRAKLAWKDFCNAVRDEAERLLVQKAVQAVMSWAVGTATESKTGSTGKGGKEGGGTGGMISGAVSGASVGYEIGGVYGGIVGALIGGYGGYAAGGQFGTYVPGPEGRPRAVMAHGGERIVPAQAAPAYAGAPSGGDTIHYHGAIYSERQLFRAQRRSIRSRGERSLA